jgi:antitoxin component of MazEF toxin-antitoxin module
MPLLRKIVLHGASRGVTLPSSWIALIERETGKKLTEVSMEVNGSITIKPVFEKKSAGDSC